MCKKVLFIMSPLIPIINSDAYYLCRGIGHDYQAIFNRAGQVAIGGQDY